MKTYEIGEEIAKDLADIARRMYEVNPMGSQYYKLAVQLLRIFDPKDDSVAQIKKVEKPPVLFDDISQTNDQRIYVIGGKLLEIIDTVNKLVDAVNKKEK